MYEGKYPHKRYRLTLEFLKKHIAPGTSILDLGVSNPFSEIMKAEGYHVSNTTGEDLDHDFSTVRGSKAKVVTDLQASTISHPVISSEYIRVGGVSNQVLYISPG